MTKEQRDKLRTLALAATPGEWYHVQAFQRRAAERTIHGKVPGQRVDFVSTERKPVHKKIIIPMEGRESTARSEDMAYIAAANPATVLALLDRIDELEAELAEAKVDAERYKRELQQDELVHVGYTNPYQIKYAKDEEGSFYPDTDNECYIPLYMLKKHKHRLGPDAAIDKARGR